LPRILDDGALYPKSVLDERGIAPRSSAQVRDRALGLANYVHLAMKMHTPLLRDKLRKGFAHAVLVMDGSGVFSVPGVGLLTQNTKAWRERAAYDPLTEPSEIAALLKQWQYGRRRGLEVLVPYGLSLQHIVEIAFFHQEHLDVLSRYIRQAHADKSWELTLAPGSTVAAASMSVELVQYLEDCLSLGSAPQPPHIPFD